MTHSIEIEKDIFEDLMKFYGKLFGLPPLAAKIYAYLIFDFEKKGLGFEEVVTILSASKSSVSSSLKLLEKQDLIRSIYREGERKRYFVINDDYVKYRFLQIVERLKTELDILDRLNNFRGKTDKRYSTFKKLTLQNISNIENSLSNF